MSLKDIRSLIANRVRTLRNSKGWTQERLAEKIDVHPTYISRIESAKKLPTLTIICKIADVLGVYAYELLVDERKTKSIDYKRKKLMSIVNESGPADIDIYSTILSALHKSYKTKHKLSI